jgi:hypothetical protein
MKTRVKDMIYYLNIAGGSFLPFTADDDEAAMTIAQFILDLGPHGDPNDGPTTIEAGVFDEEERLIGIVSIEI